MKVKTLAVAAVLLVAVALLWSLWEPRVPGQLLDTATISPETSITTTAIDITEEVREKARTVDPDRSPLAPPTSGGQLVVRVQWAEDHTPAPGVAVRATREDVPFIRRGIGHPWISTNDEGLVVFRGLNPGDYTIEAVRGGETDITLGQSQRMEVLLAIPEGIRVEGSVVDESGVGIAGARIVLSHSSQDDAFTVAMSDENGSFKLRSVKPGKIVSAFPPDQVPTMGWRAVGEPGDEIEVTLEARGRPAGVIDGIVYGPDGRPLQGASVFVGVSQMGMYFPGGEASPPNVLVHTDEEGRFRAEGVAAHENYGVPVWVRAVGCSVWTERLDLRPGEERFLEVHLARGASVRGRVLDASGNPVQGVGIQALQPSVEPDKGFAYQGPYWGRVGVSSGADGSFELVDLEPGEVKITASHRQEAQDSIDFVLPPGSEQLWNPLLNQGLSIQGVLVDSSGKPLEGWRIRGDGPQAARRPRDVSTDSTGRFLLEGCDDGLYRIEVFDPESQLFGATMTIAGIRPAGEDLKIEIPPHRTSNSAVVGEILTPDGTPMEGIRMHMWHADVDGVTRTGPQGREATWEGRRFRIDKLPAGHYVLEVEPRDRVFGFLSIPSFELRPDQVLDLGTHRFQRPGTVELTMLDPDGTPTEEASVAVQGPGFYGGGVDVKDGKGLSTPLQPGRHILTISRKIAPLTREPIEVFSGQTTRVVVQLPNMVTRKVRYPAFENPESRCVVRWYSGTEEVGRLRLRLWQVGVTSEAEFEFVPGDYRVEVTDLLGRSVSTTFQVSDDEYSDQVLMLPSPFAK